MGTKCLTWWRDGVLTGMPISRETAGGATPESEQPRGYYKTKLFSKALEDVMAEAGADLSRCGSISVYTAGGEKIAILEWDPGSHEWLSNGPPPHVTIREIVGVGTSNEWVLGDRRVVLAGRHKYGELHDCVSARQTPARDEVPS